MTNPTNSTEAPKKKGGKGALLGCGALGLAALVGIPAIICAGVGGWYFLMRSGSADLSDYASPDEPAVEEATAEVEEAEVEEADQADAAEDEEGTAEEGIEGEGGAETDELASAEVTDGTDGSAAPATSGGDTPVSTSGSGTSTAKSSGSSSGRSTSTSSSSGSKSSGQSTTTTSSPPEEDETDLSDFSLDGGNAPPVQIVDEPAAGKTVKLYVEASANRIKTVRMTVVVVDEERFGAPPVAVDVEPGRHRVSWLAPDSATECNVTVGSKNKTVKINLDEPACP